MTLRIVYMGTPDFAVPALRALHSAGHDIACVYSQPPRPAGRGKKPRPSPVQQAAQGLGLSVRTPVNFKAEEDRAALKALDFDVGIVAAYGLILPQSVLDMAPHGFINIHGSLLPRWRGAAPIQRAIEAGDDESGITIMQMEKGLDTGPMALMRSCPIAAQTTAGMLHDALMQMGSEMIAEACVMLEAGTLKFTPQDDALATYAPKIDKAEAPLDFAALDAPQMQRKIHALSPAPGAYCHLDGARLKLLEVETVSADQSHLPGALPGALPGTIIDEDMAIACARGVIRPIRVQLAGKSAMSRADFLRGTQAAKGSVLA